MLKQSVATDVLTYEEESSNNQVIHKDVELPPVNNIQEVTKPQEEPDSDTEIHHIPEVLGGVQDYILVRDKENYSTKPSKIYGYEDLRVYELLTSFDDHSTF